MNQFIFVYITNPTEKEAIRIAQSLLKKRLISCANIFPIKSLYWWQNKINKENEYVLIGKTIKSRFEKIKKEVEKIHSYTIPCIIKISVNSNKKYFEWLKNEIVSNT